MKNSRFFEIDFLRGISILAMVIIHTSVYYLGTGITFFLWDYSQFAVVAFLFCSGYLYFQKTQKTQIVGESDYQKIGKSESLTARHSDMPSFPSILKYIKNRLFRLIVPYYIFVPFFFFVLFIIHSKLLTLNYVLQSTFLIGGIDINWLVLLFVQFVFVMPFLAWAFMKYKIVLFLYTTVAVGSSIFFIFHNIPFSWKWIMWLPWSTVLIFSLIFVKYKLFQKQKFVLLAGIVFGIFYIMFRIIETNTGHTLTQFANKYPPTMYNISFGLAAVCFIYLFAQFLRLTIPLITFLSKNSYSFYFIHYCVLILLAGYFTKHGIYWGLFFLCVLSLSLVIQFSLLRLLPFLRSRHS